MCLCSDAKSLRVNEIEMFLALELFYVSCHKQFLLYVAVAICKLKISVFKYTVVVVFTLKVQYSCTSMHGISSSSMDNPFDSAKQI